MAHVCIVTLWEGARCARPGSVYLGWIENRNDVGLHGFALRISRCSMLLSLFGKKDQVCFRLRLLFRSYEIGCGNVRDGSRA
jgi:hypothetical protein